MSSGCAPHIAWTLAIGLSALGCGSPTGPSSGSQPNLSGSWNGTAADSSGGGSLNWQITQSGSSFSGSLTIVDADSHVGGRGSVSGSIAGASLHFSMIVPTGGFDAPFDSCSANVSGDAQVSTAAITGAYSGTNSCTGTITSGELALTRAN